MQSVETVVASRTIAAIHQWMLRHPMPRVEDPDPSMAVIEVDTRIPGPPSETPGAAWERARERIESIIDVPDLGLSWHTVPTLSWSRDALNREGWSVYCSFI